MDLSAWIKFGIPLDSDAAFYNVCFDSRKAVGPCGAAPEGASTEARIRRTAPGEWTIWANGSSDQADLIKGQPDQEDPHVHDAGTIRDALLFHGDMRERERMSLIQILRVRRYDELPDRSAE